MKELIIIVIIAITFVISWPSIDKKATELGNKHQEKLEKKYPLVMTRTFEPGDVVYLKPDSLKVLIGHGQRWTYLNNKCYIAYSYTWRTPKGKKWGYTTELKIY
jgi:hypothetical protein